MTKLTREECRSILEDIEYGRGRIAEVAKRHPWIVEESRKIFIFPNPIRVFRAVGVRNTLRDECIVSSTIDARVALTLLIDQPIIMTSTEMVSLKPHLLVYDISHEHIIAYVPYLATVALNAVHRRIRLEDRHGEKLSISVVEQAAELEKEIVIQVKGVTPRVVEFEKSIHGRMMMHLALDIASGKQYDNADDYIRQQNIGSMHFHYDEHDRADLERRIKLYHDLLT